MQIVNKPPRFITDGLDDQRDSSPLGYGSDDGPATGREFVPGAPQAISRPMRRMPSMDDLPVTGQNQLRAYEAPPKTHGIEAQKKKVGFFDRITGRNRDKAEPQDEAPPQRQAGELPGGDRRSEAYHPEPGQTPMPPTDGMRGNQEDQFEPGPPQAAPMRPITAAVQPDAGRHDVSNSPANSISGARSRHDAAFETPPPGEGVQGPAIEGQQHHGDERHYGDQDGDDVAHSGRSAGYVSGAIRDNQELHGHHVQEPAPAQRQSGDHHAQPPRNQGLAEERPHHHVQGPATAGERYPTIEINKGAPLDHGYDPDDDEPIADIPPFLRKTTNKR